MNGRKLPSPALVIAVLALFVSLSGTAVAAGVVPLAKRALTADNSKKLGGQTADAIAASAAQRPGPASSAAGLITVKQASDSLAPHSGREFVIGCDGGKKVISGGWSGDNAISFDDRPVSDTAWSTYLGNPTDAGTSVTLYAVCIG